MTEIKGRFAPSPTGRMHLGNIFAALLSWLSAKSKGGKWVLRIEDLDPQRSRHEYAEQIEDDLHWLGLHPDEGGLADIGSCAPYTQSRRHHIYEQYLERLRTTGLTYPCRCTRADILATQAPHRTDPRIIYAGTCRPDRLPCTPLPRESYAGKATRLYIPSTEIEFDDLFMGSYRYDPSRECGDMVLRRADGAWAYQLAVVVDDALMGITEVVRGSDLLSSVAPQLYLYRLLGLPAPRFGHIPLLSNAEGRRLSKRDASLSMAELRRRYSPEQLIGMLAMLAGQQSDPSPLSASDLLGRFEATRIPRRDNIILQSI